VEKKSIWLPKTEPRDALQAKKRNRRSQNRKEGKGTATVHALGTEEGGRNRVASGKRSQKPLQKKHVRRPRRKCENFLVSRDGPCNDAVGGGRTKRGPEKGSLKPHTPEKKSISHNGGKPNYQNGGFSRQKKMNPGNGETLSPSQKRERTRILYNPRRGRT